MKFYIGPFERCTYISTKRGIVAEARGVSVYVEGGELYTDGGRCYILVGDERLLVYACRAPPGAPPADFEGPCLLERGAAPPPPVERRKVGSEGPYVLERAAYADTEIHSYLCYTAGGKTLCVKTEPTVEDLEAVAEAGSRDAKFRLLQMCRGRREWVWEMSPEELEALLKSCYARDAYDAIVSILDRDPCAYSQFKRIDTWSYYTKCAEKMRVEEAVARAERAIGEAERVEDGGAICLKPRRRLPDDKFSQIRKQLEAEGWEYKRGIGFCMTFT